MLLVFLVSHVVSNPLVDMDPHNNCIIALPWRHTMLLYGSIQY